MEGIKNNKIHYYKTHTFIPVNILPSKQAHEFAMSNDTHFYVFSE